MAIFGSFLSPFCTSLLEEHGDPAQKRDLREAVRKREESTIKFFTFRGGARGAKRSQPGLESEGAPPKNALGFYEENHAKIGRYTVF